MEGEKVEKIEVPKAEWDKVLGVVTAVEGITNDLRDERAKRQLAEAALEDAKKNPPVIVPVTDDMTTKVTSILKETLDLREKEDIKNNLLSAETNFKNANKEFHPDNDAGGVKYAAFKQKLARINLTGLKSQDDFMGAFNEALTLMGTLQNTQQRITPGASTPSGGSGPTSINNSNLSQKEHRLLDQLGWTEERYLAIKKKNPAYVQNILNGIQP